MENLVFTLPSFVNQGLGLTLNRPGFATTDLSFAYLCLAVFVIIALFIVNFRRSTTGLALNAARWSEAGARTSGISVVQMKVIAGALAALIAGIGGGLLALAQTSFQPSEFATFAGVVWLAVLVTIGVRSNAAALVAGLAFVMLPALCAGLPADLDRRTSCRCSSVSAPSRPPSTRTVSWPSRAGGCGGWCSTSTPGRLGDRRSSLTMSALRPAEVGRSTQRPGSRSTSRDADH